MLVHSNEQMNVEVNQSHLFVSNLRYNALIQKNQHIKYTYIGYVIHEADLSSKLIYQLHEFVRVDDTIQKVAMKTNIRQVFHAG
jgi:hypothetical protein